MEYCSYSNGGNRDVNEDALLCVTDGDFSCFAVADGLGGHGRGEIASQTVLESVRSSVNPSLPGAQLTELLEVMFEKAQQALLEKQVELHAPFEMKTTLTVLCIQGKQLCWGHIGDSRLYAFRKNQIATRTLDHSVPQMLVLSRELPERKIRKHPDRNLLLRVMGVEWDRRPYELSDIYDADEFQAFLLCSDGFWELITERKMCALLKKSRNAEEWLKRMTEVVEKNGRKREMDNYSAIAVFVT